VGVSVYVSLAGALALCATARAAARWLAPAPAATLVVVAALAAAGAWIWDLGLLMGSLVGRIGTVAALGHWSSSALAAHDPVPATAATVATGLLAAAALGLAACVRQVARELRRAWPAARRLASSQAGDVVIVDDPAARAVAVPGLPGRVVLTTGMVRALAPEERRVLLAHERAHLRHQHGAYRLAIRVAAGLLPAVRPLVAECDHLLERWADEDAARAVGDRRLAARALARAALAARERPAAEVLVAGFAERGVGARVHALLDDPPVRRLLPLVVPLAMAAAIVATSVDAGEDLDALFDLARRLGGG
jgi:Zn-dependent protease with chaperone function